MFVRLNNPLHSFVYVFLLLGLLANSSCEESPWIEDVEIASEENTKPTPSAHQKTLDDGVVLEGRMQWASYASARIFCQDREAREEVARFLDRHNTNAVSLDQLIVSTENTPRFRELFIDQISALLFDLRQVPKPSHNSHSAPPHPASERTLTDVPGYITALTTKNCIELFFPNGLSLSGADFYYSTAHPMTLAQSNYGYELSCIHMNDDINHRGSNGIIIDESLVQEGSEVIVTRPYRTSDCSYDKYDDIDFTQFLSQ